MKNLTSKIGKYLSQLGTQLLKVLWSDDLRLEFLLVLFETFFQNCRFANFSFQSGKYIANLVYLGK